MRYCLRDRVILKVLLRVLARQNPNFLSCAVPAQRPAQQNDADKTPGMRKNFYHGFPFFVLRQHRTIPALRLKHRSGSCGTASALPKCSIMSGCGTRIVLRGQKPLALCDRCPCFGSLFPPLAALTFAASSIICAFGLAAAAPRSPYRHLELCGIALIFQKFFHRSSQRIVPEKPVVVAGGFVPSQGPIHRLQGIAQA